MKVIIRNGLIVVSAITASSLAVWFALRDDGGETTVTSNPVNTAIRERLPKVSAPGKKRKTTVIAETVPNAPKKAQTGEVPDEDDEDSLTSLQKTVMAELQDAIDNHSLASVRKALSKFQSSVADGGSPRSGGAGGGKGGGSGNVPRCMKRAAVYALGLFGKDAIVDMIDFMADADTEICEDAFDKFETALQDEMGDEERSALLKSALSAISDPDRIDSLLVNLNDMGNSVKANTIKAILQNGTDTAKSRMNERLDIYTDETVKTMADIDRWAAENPD